MIFIVNKGLKILIDKADYEFIESKKWHLNGKYIRCSDGYLHRMILKADKNKQVDHINGDRLDNRRCNLRVCSKAENLKNKTKYKSNKSGYKGVDMHYGKIRAQISVNGVSKHLGYFKTFTKAADAYNQAASNYYREFASLN